MIEIDLATLKRRVGEEVAVSDWIQVTQARINQFAEATEDRFWIHVDAERAATVSPFKTTIAHGFLTLSLASHLFANALRVEPVGLMINYGLNRVRFMSPVRSGALIRGRFRPVLVEDLAACVQITWTVTVELEGSQKPCSVIDWLVRYY